MNTYDIRLNAVTDRYNENGDTLLYDRELYSLMVDLTKAINREAGEETYKVLASLRERVENIKESL